MAVSESMSGLALQERDRAGGWWPPSTWWGGLGAERHDALPPSWTERPRKHRLSTTSGTWWGGLGAERHDALPPSSAEWRDS